MFPHFQKGYHARAARNILKYFSFLIVVYFITMSLSSKNVRKRKYLFVITTIDTFTKKLERLGKVLSNSNNDDILWIVSENVKDQNDEVLDVLGKLRVPFIYLNSLSEDKDNVNLWKQRQLGIDFVLKLWKMGTVDEDSVVYFADLDMMYDSKLFTKIRNVKKAVVWPVGMMGQIVVNAPVVQNGELKGFETNAKGNSQATVFPGMAFNVQLIVKSGASFGHFCRADNDLETCLLNRLGVKLSDFNVLNVDDKVLVWYDANPNSDRDRSPENNDKRAVASKFIKRE